MWEWRKLHVVAGCTVYQEMQEEEEEEEEEEEASQETPPLHGLKRQLTTKT